MTRPTPPHFLEALLRLVLAPRNRESVSGDLLEEYREVIQPLRGSFQADVWFFKQAAGYLWRGNMLWSLLLSHSFIARTAVDWLTPTTDFHTRSMVSTLLAIGILLSAGFYSSMRSDSYWTGVFAGTATSLTAAIISVFGVAVLLLLHHDPQTMMAIQRSGGLEEAFMLPVMLVIPGMVFGTVGGLFGGVIRRVRR